MGWELFGLYLFTRLDNINIFCALATGVVGIILLGCLIDYGINSEFCKDDDPRQIKAAARIKTVRWMWIPFVAVLLLLPSQKEAMFILAGTGVIEAAKTDTAQRIATKSVGVVEKYLDEMLMEKSKKDEKK